MSSVFFVIKSNKLKKSLRLKLVFIFVSSLFYVSALAKTRDNQQNVAPYPASASDTREKKESSEKREAGAKNKANVKNKDVLKAKVPKKSKTVKKYEAIENRNSTDGSTEKIESDVETDLRWDEIEPVSEYFVLAPASRVQWRNYDLIGLRDQKSEIVGIFEPDTSNLRQLNLVYLLGKRLIQNSDTLVVLKLDAEQEGLRGTTRLWKYKEFKKSISSQFKPLLTQGSIIGDTAQTLLKGESFFSTVGSYAYGINNSFSVSTNLPGNAIGSPNLKIKARAFHGDFQTWSFGINMAQDRSSDEKLMNIDIMWDSVLSDTLIAHSIVSAAVISFDDAREVAALKSYGSSSIQSGYEYIMRGWGRLLAGPSYNIEQKAIGGYFSYVKIFDNTHVQLSLTSNNIRKLNFSAEEGYLAFIEAYWRW